MSTAKPRTEPSSQRYWRRSVGLVTRTTPFLMLRMGVYLAFFVVLAVWIGIWGGLAVLFGERAPILSLIFAVIGFAGPGALFALARRYVLYMVTGAHIAVVTRLLHGDGLPDGKGQIAYGREIVKSQFRDMSLLFVLDRLIDGAVRGLTNTVVRIVNILPLGGQVTSVARLLMQIVRRSLSYVDEAILSYAVAQGEDNVWRSARHGVILYGQAYKPILKTAVKIWLVGQVLFVGLLVALALPAYLLLGLSDSGVYMVAVVVCTLLLAKLIELALFEPFAMVYTMTTYHGAIQGLTPDPVWDQRLQQASKKFRELVGKARDHAGAAPDPLDSPPPVAAQPAQPPGHVAVGPAASPPAPAAPPAVSASAGQGMLGGLSGLGRGGLGGLVGGLLDQATRPSQTTQQPAPVPQPSVPPDSTPDPGDDGPAEGSQ